MINKYIFIKDIWKKFFVKLICATIITIFISLIVTSCFSQQEYQIVIAGDYTGNTAGIGNSVYRGAEYVMSNIGNELTGGKKIKLTKADDKGDDNKSQSNARHYSLESSLLAVIGHSTSGNTEKALEIYGPKNIPVFLPVATDPQVTKISKQNGWNNVYRLVPTDELQASKIAEYAQKWLKPKKVFVINDDSTYGKSLGDLLAGAFSNKSIFVWKRTIIPKDAERESIKSKLSQVLANKQDPPDLIVYAGYYKEGGLITTIFRENNFIGSIFLTDGCFVPDIFPLLGSNPGEIYISFISQNIKNIDNASDLISKIKKSDPDLKESELAYAPFGADSVRIIVEISQKILAEKNNLNFNRNAIIKFLNKNETNRYFNKNLILGPYRFNDNGDNELGKNYIYKLGNGQWIFLE